MVTRVLPVSVYVPPPSPRITVLPALTSAVTVVASLAWLLIVIVSASDAPTTVSFKPTALSSVVSSAKVMTSKPDVRAKFAAATSTPSAKFNVSEPDPPMNVAVATISPAAVTLSSPAPRSILAVESASVTKTTVS